MAENNFEASVGLKVDNASIDKAIKQVSTKLANGLSKADAKLSIQLSKQIDKDLGKIGRSFEKGADKLSKVLEKGLKIGLGAGASALYAFLKSGTPEALRFSNSLDKVKMAWAKVGQTLATKINFRGKNLTEWAEVVADKIENLDTKQIEKMVGYFKAMAVSWALIKTAQGVVGLGKLVGDLSSLVKSMKGLSGLSAGSQAVSSALGATTGVSVAAGVGGAGVMSSAIKKRLLSALSGGGTSDAEALRIWANSAKSVSKTPEISAAIREQALINSRNMIPVLKTPRALGMRPSGGAWRDMWSARNLPISDAFPKTSAFLSKNAGFMKWGGRALGAIGAGYDAYSQIKGGKSVTETAGNVASSVSVGLLGVKIGAAIGTAILPGIGTAIGGVLGGAGGYFGGGKLFDMFVPKAETGGTIAEGKTKANDLAAFIKVFNTGKSNEAFGKDLMSSSNKYLGGDIPLEERMKLIPDAVKNINLQTSTIKELEGMQQTDTVKKQIEELTKSRDAIKAFIETTITNSESQTDAQKAFRESIKDADKKIEEKRNSAIEKEFKDRVELDKFATKKTAPKGGSISSGSIEDLPDILSQSINDQANQRDADMFDLQEKQTEIAERNLEILEERAQSDKEITEMQKEKDKADKEFQEKVANKLETLAQKVSKLTGGSSTVVNY